VGSNRKVEGCAFARSGLKPDVAIMAVDHALHCGQADSAAGKVRHGVKALEGREQFVCILHVKADAIVTHEEDGRILGRLVASRFPP
jgi:hypothetical protein